jgi:hypothetical protein
MGVSTAGPSRLRAIALALTCGAFGAAAVFFAWYTARLVYVNLTAPDASAHRQSGMYIGAVAFPSATAVFAAIAHWCGTAARRTLRNVSAQNERKP